MVLSASNCPNLTQRWKVQLSNSIEGCFRPFCCSNLSISNLSFKPNLHSGMPVRNAFIITWPDTSLRNTVPAPETTCWSIIKHQISKILPFAEIRTFTDSNTSMYTSFLRYRIPSRRQSVAPVICAVRCALLRGISSAACEHSTRDGIKYPDRKACSTFTDLE